MDDDNINDKICSLYRKGRNLGYTNQEVRNIIRKQKLMKQVMDCNNIEDVKILLLSWIDEGFVK